MDPLLTALKAAAEPTRLRLLALCAHGELTVSELTQILGQSQPRVSRHLKLLCEAGLLGRQREGTSVWFRLAEGRGRPAELARTLVDALGDQDPVLATDLARLDAIKQARSEAAEAYFRRNAPDWDRIRGLQVPEPAIEAALVALLATCPGGRVGDLLDIGTGTGRMLEVLGPRTERAVGVDLSREMLAVARVNLERAGLAHCQVRQGDLYRLPFPAASFDVALMCQVLHFVEAPAEAIQEAARVLRPGGQLWLTDFAPHAEESLRSDHAHRWLGFTDAAVIGWCRLAGLDAEVVRHLSGDPLTVVVWAGRRSACDRTSALRLSSPTNDSSLLLEKSGICPGGPV